MSKSRVHRYILLSENDVQVQTDAEGGQRQGAQEVEHDAGVDVQCLVEEHCDQGHAHQGHLGCNSIDILGLTQFRAQNLAQSVAQMLSVRNAGILNL